MLTKFFLCVLLTPLITAQLTNVTIPLNKTTTSGNKEVYGDFFYLNRNSTLHISFENVNLKYSFFIFQVHSHLYKVTVYNNTLFSHTSMYGTNVGFYFSATSLDTYYIVNSNKNVDLKLYISVHGYGKLDPIPGGCNIEYPVPVYPSMRIQQNFNYLFEDVAPAKRANDINCSPNDNVTIKFRMMYLPERDFSADTYFEGIRTMMIQSGFRYEMEVPRTAGWWRNRRMLSAYPGTGAIYVAIVRDYNENTYAAYIPTYSYACSPLDDDCELFDDVLSQFVCAVILFTGVFLCYFGHRFFKTEMFLMGLMSGAVLTYMLISLMAEMDQSALVAASVISGVFFGAIWLMFWWLYAIPLMSVMLPTLNLGFLCAAIFHYAAKDNLQALVIPTTFWFAFACIVLSTVILLTTITYHANILACGVLGAYAALYPIDNYLGSNLKYIMINIIRRVTVPMFDKAALVPPFQWRESLVVTLWVLMSVTGIAYQYYSGRGKPPFPPPPRSTRPEPPNYGTIHRPISRAASASHVIGRGTTSDSETARLLP